MARTYRTSSERPGHIIGALSGPQVIASPPVTVLVCTRGRSQLVSECVRAIVAILGARDELIVVDSEFRGVPDLTAGLDHPRLRWIGCPRPGKSRQLNFGIRRACNEVILVTDDDCLVSPGWISAMSTPFLEHDVGIAFGDIEGLTRLPGPPPEKPMPGPAPPAMWRFSHGAAMGIRRQAAIDAGGFDERLGPGAPLHGEEADLLLRVQSRGWRCFVADAPPVRHIEWRSATEERQNLLVYERGGGAWVGAAIRRRSASATIPIMTRLRYQAAYLRAPDVFALRAETAFCAGLVAGLRLKPERFLGMGESQAGGSAPGPPRSRRIGGLRLEQLPWPTVHGRRCLCLDNDDRISDELHRRQASEVTLLDLHALTPEDLSESNLGLFDLVVAHDIGSREEPIRWFRALARICNSHLLSIEPIDPWLTLLGRSRPYVVHRSGQTPGQVMNGAAHRGLLEAGGFRVQLAAPPWLFHPTGGRLGAKRAILAVPRDMSPSATRSSVPEGADAGARPATEDEAVSKPEA